MENNLKRMKLGHSQRIKDTDGNVIVVERVLLGKFLGWHLHHGRKHIVSKEVDKVARYLTNHMEPKRYHGEIVDLGEY